MNASNRVAPLEQWPAEASVEVRAGTAVPQALPELHRTPALRLKPLLVPAQPRRFARVPTHAVGVFPEHREYPRATLNLPLRLRSVDGSREAASITLVTRDISSTGVYFLCPKQLAAGTAIEIEIVLVSKPMGLGNVVAVTMAHVQRMEPAAMPGWYGVAASFDDFQFDRDDGLPTRFLKR